MRIKLAKQVFAFNVLWVVLTLTAFAILINLSWWQLKRADIKTQQIQRLSQLQSDGALQAPQLAQLAKADIDGAPFKASGRWVPPFVWLLDNQIVNGRVGYDVVIPVQINGLSEELLVNLGWLPAESSRDVLPQLQIPLDIALDGLLRTQTDGLLLLGQNVENESVWPMRIQQVSFDELSTISGLTLYPALLYQQQASEFLPHYQPVVMPPEKHRGYALQWFLLGVAVIGVALAASHQGKAHYE